MPIGLADVGEMLMIQIRETNPGIILGPRKEGDQFISQNTLKIRRNSTTQLYYCCTRRGTKIQMEGNEFL